MISNDQQWLQIATDNEFRLTSIGWLDDDDGDDGCDKNYVILMRYIMMLIMMTNTDEVDDGTNQ